MGSLRLDIDGVLVRDKLLLEHVKENCVRYVAAKLPDCKNPRETNALLYKTYGHTARGLQRTFQVNTSDFNRKVYDKSLIAHLADVLQTKEFQKEAEMIHGLTHQGWDITLFTNSPWVWAYRVALAIGDNVSVRCPGNPNDSFLKPEIEAYIFSLQEFNVMVDDSLNNLEPVRYIPNWHSIHFTDTPTSDAWCSQVTSIEELCEGLGDVPASGPKDTP